MSQFPGVRHLVKICGVTSVEDARVVLESGADALGMIFADSPRSIDEGVAVRVATLARSALTRVAVFRDRHDDEILATLERVDVDAVQLHDSLSVDLEAALREGGKFIIKALSIYAEDFAVFDERRVDAVLIDGPRAGSGIEHDWDRLGSRSFSVPLVAAGGLTPQNVAALIRAIGPWGVDCASGVETRPGVKDAERLKNFVANARDAFSEMEEK